VMMTFTCTKRSFNATTLYTQPYIT